MNSGARSQSHRWVVGPRGEIVRQRLGLRVKEGWRLARWDELSPDDPSTTDVWPYLDALVAASRTVNGRVITYFRDGRPMVPQPPIQRIA